MSIPYKVVEQYIFHFSGFIVNGRVTSHEDNGKIIWEWDVDYEDGSHPIRHNFNQDAARENLFSYMEKFNESKAKKVEYY